MSLASGEGLLAAGSALGLIAVALWTRHVFIKQATPLRVDHHYWLLVADAFRKVRKLPIALNGRYLLEPRQQAYPPFFGWFLSRLDPAALASSCGVWVCQAADVAALGIGVGLGLWLGMGPLGVVALIATVLFAPTLVAYNTQLNPRSFGNLFLTTKMAAEVMAGDATGGEAWLWWSLALAATAAVWLTHKMTSQLMLALWLPWAMALGLPLAWVAPPAGLVLAGLVIGPGAMLYQIAAHVDIVRFWSRHWPNIGVHAINQSAIYGKPGGGRPGAFHQAGFRGVAGHLRHIVGYVPVMALLPVLALLGPPVPVWLMVWTLGTLFWALATALVPALKGLGAGSLYMYFGVVPAGLWIGLAADSGDSLAVGALLASLAVCAVSLYLGWKQRQRRAPKPDEGFARLIERLRTMPQERVAVMPLFSVETVAAETPHKVLWGAHGYGFDLLEPIFPVVSRPLAETFARHRVTRFVWSEAWWPGAAERISNELKVMGIEAFGQWRTASVGGLPAPPVVRVARLLRDDRAIFDYCTALSCDAGMGASVELFELKVAEFSPGSLYRRLRALRPEIADCRGAGPFAVIVANFAGVPHRLVSPPVTWLESKLVRGGLASAVPQEFARPGSVAFDYRRCVAGTPAVNLPMRDDENEPRY